MTGFLESAGVWVEAGCARPSLRRARRPCAPPDTPAIPAAVPDAPLTGESPPLATSARPPARAWHNPARAPFSLRQRPQSEDVDAMLAWGSGASVVARPAAASASPVTLSLYEQPPAPVPPLPVTHVAGRPHHRPSPGRGRESGVIFYGTAWVGAAPLAWNSECASASRPHGRGRAEHLESLRHPPGDFATELFWAGQSVKPSAAPAKAGASGDAAPPRAWEGETLAPAHFAAALSRPGRRPGAAGPAYVTVSPAVDLHWQAAALSGRSVTCARPARAGSTATAAPPALAPVEQSWVCQAAAVIAPRHARGGSSRQDDGGVIYAGYADRAAGPTDQGWLHSSSARPVRAALPGRSADGLTLHVALVLPEPWVDSRQVAAPPRATGRSHVEYSAPDWLGAGLVVYAGAVVPEES